MGGKYMIKDVDDKMKIQFEDWLKEKICEIFSECRNGYFLF